MRLMIVLGLLALLLAPALRADTAPRRHHALLIGASTYPALEARYWLKGPANDVALVVGYLTSASPVPFAPGDVTVLADGVAGSRAPTLAAIRAAFADLTARVGPGDFVYLHFSGHGSQAPAADPMAELDGLDELFLPVDIGPWDNGVGAVVNALADDEIGTMLDALRAKGADVWAVFDSCHSGTVTRAAPAQEDDIRMRQLPGVALGIPETALDAAETPRALAAPRERPDGPLNEAAAGGAGGGSLVAFFAAQTNETTPERNMPRGKPGRQPQGVFTYTLFEVLAEHPGITYRQLAQEVLRRYGTRNLARATPLFEGDLDRVVFGAAAGVPVAQWLLAGGDAGLTVPAGTLHGLAPGQRLAVMANAADPADKALGVAEVVWAEAFQAGVALVDGDPPLAPGGLPKGAYLRRTASEADYSLTVALPERGSGAADMAEAAGRLLAAEGASGPRLRFVAPGAAADLRLAVLPASPRPDALWILPDSGLIGPQDYATTPSVGTAGRAPEAVAEALGETLAAMAKALNLLKVGEGMGGAGLAVDVTLLTRSAGRRDLTPLDTGGVPRLIPGDEVHLQAVNRTPGPVDLNVLYIGSDYSISHLFAGRLQPGDTLRQGLARITDAAFGRDRVVVVLTPAAPHSAVEDLRFLAQEALEVTRGRLSPLGVALAEAGFGETTRAAVSLMDGTEGPAPAMLQFDLDTVPGG